MHPLFLQSPGSLLTFTATPNFPAPLLEGCAELGDTSGGWDSSPQCTDLPASPV